MFLGLAGGGGILTERNLALNEEKSATETKDSAQESQLPTYQDPLYIISDACPVRVSESESGHFLSNSATLIATDIYNIITHFDFLRAFE